MPPDSLGSPVAGASTAAAASNGAAASPAARTFARCALALLCAVRVLGLAPFLRYPDLVLDYPFPGGDGLQWIAEGLAWAGHPLPAPTRPPLLPLLLAAFERLGALPWFPVLHQLVLPAGCVALYRFLERRHRPGIALIATAVPLLGSVAANLTLEVMADTVAAVLLFASLAALLTAADRPRRYVAAGALAALSALAQPVALLASLPALATLWLCRRPELRRRELWAGAAVFLVVVVPWTAWSAWRELGHGTAASAQQHWAQLAFTPQPAFYAGAAAGMWGLPALALAAVGLVALVRERDPAGYLLALLGVTFGTFFGAFYAYPGQRFLLYLLLPSGVALAAGLARLRWRWLRGLAGLAAVLWAAWPIPGGPVAETRFTLAPLPGVFADSTSGAPALSAFAPAEAWRSSAGWRVRHAAPRRPGAGFLDADLAGRGAVVFLHGEPPPPRHHAQPALAAALRRRVGWAPAALLPPDWWGWRSARFAGHARGYTFFRLGLPGLPPATVVFEQRDPAWRRVRRGVDSRQRMPPPACLLAAWAEARRLAALAGDGDPLMALAPAEPPHTWQRLAPFAVDSANLYVLTASQAGAAREELARDAGPPLLSTAAFVVRPARPWGHRALVVSPAGDGELGECRTDTAVSRPVRRPRAGRRR